MTSKEALDILRECIAEFRVTGSSKITHDEVINAKYELDKLVERDTPMKVIHNRVTDYNTHNQWEVIHCPKCSKVLIQSAYVMPTMNPVFCDECGQGLDWSE